MDVNAIYKLSYGLHVVGVKTEKGFGGCIVDAVSQVGAGDSPLIMLANNKQSYTNECIHKTGEFTLSILPEDIDLFVIGNFGFQSARNAEKWANVPHTIKNGLPRLDDAVAYLRIRVVNTLELTTHSMFICEVADAEFGKNPAKPLIYGDYQATMKDAAAKAFDEFVKTGKPPVRKM
jgi:flavin reductase (DIM6/NTAB) family NADH-FMN oxidoreductase RutF